MEIDSFFADGAKEFVNYQNDLRTKRAVERNIEIIGEAVSCILKKENTISISNSRKAKYFFSPSHLIDRIGSL